MSIQILTETAKLYYEDMAFKGKQIDEVLFPSLDNSRNTTVKIDTYTGNPFALRALTKGQEAHVREYEPGDGYEFEPPVFKEKTPIDEHLRDSAVAGVDPKSGAADHVRQAVHHIVEGPKGFLAAARMTRVKAALDVFLTGKFTAYNGDETVKEIDFERDSSLTLTANFSSVTMDAALKAMYDALTPFGIPRGNLAVLMGSDWFADWTADADVKEKRNYTNPESMIEEKLIPDLLKGAEGLRVAARYSITGVPVPVWILTYEPNWPYLATKDGSTAPFMPVDKAVMFNLGGPGYRCNRGVDVTSPSKQIVREVGDLVIDSFIDNDPPVEWLRSNARFMYLPANINHTCVSTGSGWT